MSALPSLWRGAAPLLLASTSTTRLMLLASAGLKVDTEAPDIDERAVEAAALPNTPRGIAGHLAREKALSVSGRHPERVVVGADQTLDCGGRLLHKPKDRAAAEKQLAILAGREHVLNSAYAIAREGIIIRHGLKSVRLTMRKLGEDQIKRYLDLTGDAALQSVGAYQVEGLGIHLFEHVDDDHSAILGLPLLPLLAAFRAMNLLAL